MGFWLRLTEQGRDPSTEREFFPLTVGKPYAVVGMSIVETVFRFLVQDDFGRALFAPAGMFDLVVAPLPDDWCFELGSGVRASGRDLWVDPVVAVWGYPELVNDPDHFDALAEGDPDAMAIFTRNVTDVERQTEDRLDPSD